MLLLLSMFFGVTFLMLDIIFSNRSQTVYPADVVLIEGILVFYFPEVRDLFHMKLFVDTDSDTRLARRGKFLKNFLNNTVISINQFNKIFLCIFFIS